MRPEKEPELRTARGDEDDEKKGASGLIPGGGRMEIIHRQAG